MKKICVIFFNLPFIFSLLFFAFYKGLFSEEVAQVPPSTTTTISNPLPASTPIREFVRDEMIVMFKSNVSDKEIEKILSAYGKNKSFKGEPNIYLVEIKNNVSVVDAIKKIEAVPQVNWAQPNYIKKMSRGVIRNISAINLTPTPFPIKNEK